MNGWAQRAAATLIAVAAFAEPVGASELAVYGGFFNVSKSSTQTEVGFEGRFRPRRWGLQPMVGLGVAEGSTWGYGGVLRPLPLGGRWRLTPGFGVALYDGDDGKDLGGVVEFRSSLELAVEVSEGVRLGVAVNHLSNAGLYDRNPGSNSAVFAVIIHPLD